jgi:hypothetical protein
MRSRLTAALLVYVGGLALLTGFVAVPFLTKKRDILAAVPSPPPLVATSLDVVRAGGHICMTGIAISAETGQMRFRVGTYHRSGPGLAVSVRSPGYGAATKVRPGYADNATVSVPLPRPPSSRLVTVCIRNEGPGRIAFYAAEDRALSRAAVFIDGTRIRATPELSFAEAKPVSIGERTGVIAGRIAAFRGFLDHAWIVWLLAFCALVAVPALIALGLAAVREGQPRSVSSGE